MYASFAGIEIPRIFDVDVSRSVVGEKARTIGGKLRSDTVAVKRVWKIQTRPMPLVVANTLLLHLESTLYAPDYFWIKGLSEPVEARINPEQLEENVIAFNENGLWHKDGRELSIVVEEV